MIGLKEQLKDATTQKQQKSIKLRIEKKEEAIKNLKQELEETEKQLKAIRESRKKSKSGLLSVVSSLFSPSK